MLDVLEILERLDRSSLSDDHDTGVVMEMIDDLRSQWYGDELLAKELNRKLFGKDLLTVEDIAWYEMLNTLYEPDDDDGDALV